MVCELAQTYPADLPDPRAILNSIGEVIYDWDISSDLIHWGANVAEVLGANAPLDFCTGRSFAEFLAPESPRTRYEAAIAASASEGSHGEPFQAHYGLMLPDAGARGDYRGRTWVEDTGRVFLGANGKPMRVHGIVRVLAEHMEIARQTAFRSVFDPMTGALNRATLADHITRMFKQAEGKQAAFAALMVGISDLDAANREHGYDATDELIGALIARLRGNLRATDVVGRYSGNKFALMLDACDGEQMQEAAKRLVELVDSDPIATSAGAIRARIEIGGVLAPRYARNAQTLLLHAEEALEAARDERQRRFVAFVPAMARKEARLRAQRISDELLAALNERRIVLAHQPVVDAATGTMAWQEVLMRMVDRAGGMAAPCHVLPLAEAAGLTTLLDHRVLELTVACLMEQPDLKLGFNISAQTAHDPEWPHRLAAALAVAPGTAARLTVEISEAHAVADIAASAAGIRAMQDLGVRVAMDDFGAGHASFRHLRTLGFDMLKIDGVFMQNLKRSPDDRLFVRTLIDLARSLEIPTVAEWVEDAETARLLAGWGVTYLQGHHFGRAEVPAGRAEVPAGAPRLASALAS